MKVKVRSKVKDLTLSTSLGGSQGLSFSWKKDNEWTVDLPTEVEYVNSFGEKKIAHRNLAQTWLNSYPSYLELVEVVGEPAVTQNKKGKKDEKD